MQKKTKVLIASILIPLAVGTVAGFLTRDAMMDYQRLLKPPLSPPSVLFPIVWTILYTLMGISAYLVYRAESIKRDDALFWYGVQLGVNFLWTIFFFALELRLFSFFWLLLLIGLIVAMIIRFYQIRPVAGLLQIPYLLWSCFAAYLNLMIYLLNR